MPVFEPDPDVWSRRDMALLQTAAVHRYWRRSSLAADVAALEALGYAVVRLDCSGWHDRAAVHGPMAAALAFPSYYGRNLDALNDCLGDVAMGDHGFPADAEGLVLVLDGYDPLVVGDPAAAGAVLDIVTEQAHYGLLFGNRILALVRTDDPTLDLGVVGGRAVPWNADEAANDRRRPG